MDKLETAATVAPGGRARVYASFLDASPAHASAPSTPHSATTTPKHSTSFMFGLSGNNQDGKGPDWGDPQSPSDWRKLHNYNLDQGTKFGVTYADPQLIDTDLFDLQKFGCNEERGWGYGGGIMSKLKMLKRLKGEFGKEWWMHPEFVFGHNMSRISVKLTDLTNGEVRWDAVYEMPEGSNFLMKDDKPIGGSHPFFEPDWCPAASGPYSHKFLLRIRNLGEQPDPATDDYVHVFFTQYNVTNLSNTYAFEDPAPPDPRGMGGTSVGA